MASGIDIYHSRRINYNRCIYWVRDEDGIGDEDELIYKKKPAGIFYATESNAETNSANMLAGVFMTEQYDVLLESSDWLDVLCKDCIVKYNGELWRVNEVQKKPYKKESQFRTKKTYKWFIGLVR